MNPLLRPILDDEALTRGLGDPEARLLVEWVIDRAEEAVARGADATPRVAALRRRARALGRFVVLWSHRGEHGAAHQLAAAERFAWPLPTEPLDPYDLMSDILSWEAAQPG